MSSSAIRCWPRAIVNLADSLKLVHDKVHYDIHGIDTVEDDAERLWSLLVSREYSAILDDIRDAVVHPLAITRVVENTQCILMAAGASAQKARVDFLQPLAKQLNRMVSCWTRLAGNLQVMESLYELHGDDAVCAGERIHIIRNYIEEYPHATISNNLVVNRDPVGDNPPRFDHEDVPSYLIGWIRFLLEHPYEAARKYYTYCDTAKRVLIDHYTTERRCRAARRMAEVIRLRTFEGMVLRRCGALAETKHHETIYGISPDNVASLDFNAIYDAVSGLLACLDDPVRYLVRHTCAVDIIVGRVILAEKCFRAQFKGKLDTMIRQFLEETEISDYDVARRRMFRLSRQITDFGSKSNQMRCLVDRHVEIRRKRSKRKIQDCPVCCEDKVLTPFCTAVRGDMHPYCDECWTGWTKTKGTCAVCRTPLKKSRSED